MLLKLDRQYTGEHVVAMGEEMLAEGDTNGAIGASDEPDARGIVCRKLGSARWAVAGSGSRGHEGLHWREV